MAFFPTWIEWLRLRETNARKRAIKAALNGTGTPLPGSYAACPSTNPRAMKSAAKTGKVTKLPIDENGGQMPDYSFDRWLQKAKEFGDDVNKLRTDYEGEDKDLEQKKKEAEKKSADEDRKDKAKPQTKDDKSSEDTQKDDATWNKLKKIHQKTLNKTYVPDSSDEED